MRKNSVYIFILVILITVMLAITVFLKKDKPEEINPTSTPGNTVIIATSTPTQASSPTQEPTPTPVTFTEISIISCGDLMYHGPQINAAFNKETGKYDFMNNLKYIKQIVTEADFAVANLETTLAGNDNGYNYQGYPNFNAPDSVLDSIKDAGFDMLLLSNNHTYDTGRIGLIRTQQKVKERGFSYIGTRETIDDNSYMVKEINGVKVGFLNYSYESGPRLKAGIMINAIFVNYEDSLLIDTFNYDIKEEFYDEVANRMEIMKKQGAEIFLIYIHWGSEYSLEPNSHQKEIAQALCNLGIDAIIGSHPHVIQPVDVLTNKNTGKRTICFYSLGNFISNQNRRTLETPPNKEYTENGVLVNLTIRRYSTGEVYISYADYTPTWVHRISMNEKLIYEVLPLPYAFEHPDSYGVNQTTFGLEHSQAAKKKTDIALKPGIDLYNEWRQGAKAA